MSEPVKSIEDIADDKRRKSSVDLTLDFLDTTQYDYEEALQQTGFGKFHLFLLAICGLIYLNTAIGKVGKYTFLMCCENGKMWPENCLLLNFSQQVSPSFRLSCPQQHVVSVNLRFTDSCDNDKLKAAVVVWWHSADPLHWFDFSTNLIACTDFQMTSEDKGMLTASPMFGMILGSAFWGVMADIKGRKYVLIATLLLDGIAGVFSSVSQNYSFFVFFRFLNGFGWVWRWVIRFSRFSQ